MWSWAKGEGSQVENSWSNVKNLKGFCYTENRRNLFSSSSFICFLILLWKNFFNKLQNIFILLFLKMPPCTFYWRNKKNVISDNIVLVRWTKVWNTNYSELNTRLFSIRSLSILSCVSKFLPLFWNRKDDCAISAYFPRTADQCKRKY